MKHIYKDCSCGGKLRLDTFDTIDIEKHGVGKAFCEICQEVEIVTLEQYNVWRKGTYTFSEEDYQRQIHKNIEEEKMYVMYVSDCPDCGGQRDEDYLCPICVSRGGK